MEKIMNAYDSNPEEEVMLGAAGWVVAQRSAQCDISGRPYSSDQQIQDAISALRARGEWPEAQGDKLVMGRALLNRRRSALFEEGIVMRPFWL